MTLRSLVEGCVIGLVDPDRSVLKYQLKLGHVIVCRRVMLTSTPKLLLSSFRLCSSVTPPPFVIIR
jgi:hypothetical protein